MKLTQPLRDPQHFRFVHLALLLKPAGELFTAEVEEQRWCDDLADQCQT